LAEHHQLSYDLTMKRIVNKDRHLRGDFMTFIIRSCAEDDSLKDYEMASNSNIVKNAGSETTAAVLVRVTYFLTRTPKALGPASGEVCEVSDRQDTTSKVPYLTVCIDEVRTSTPLC
jgi:cytochrome P450